MKEITRRGIGDRSLPSEVPPDLKGNMFRDPALTRNFAQELIMTQEKSGPDATPRIGLDLGRQIFDGPSDSDRQQEQAGASEDRTRQRAYEIWEREGRTGDPQDHWHRAERELSEVAQERFGATAGDAPPVGAVGAMDAVGEQSIDAGTAQKKSRRKRTS
jgi:hypothetical protein